MTCVINTICMIPLTITTAVIYGIMGLIGTDYDMPVAVLSALTLGTAVDFAIHFLERSRASFAETGSWQSSASVMFGEPARAISRNVLVIAIGFLPLLAAPLVPYKSAQMASNPELTSQDILVFHEQANNHELKPVVF